MTVRNTDGRPLVDGIGAERPAAGLLDGPSPTSVSNDVRNCSHADSYTEINSALQEPNSFFLNLFPGYNRDVMKTWVERLNERFDATGWSKAELAKRSGVAYDNVLKYIAGKVEHPRGDTLEKLATALGTSSLYLEHGVESPSLTTATGSAGKIQAIHVSGFVKAGIWQDARIEGPGDMDVPSVGGYPVAYQVAYIVDGESLNKIARNGDVLVCLDLIKSGVSIREDDLVIVEVSKHHGEFIDRSAKRVRKTKTGFELWPESNHPDHQEPIVLNEVDDGTDMVITAKVLWIVRKP